MDSVKRYFGFDEAGTNLRTEMLAGLTTFLTMAYIIFVNPAILGDAGMPKDAVFVATCLVAALGSLIMGLYANYPIACAPGMGLNAYFAYTVVKGMGFTWQAALGAVFISGCLFMIVTLFRVREVIVNGIPHSIRIAITAGIGLFLAIISLKTAGVVVGNPATLVTLGNLHDPHVILAVIGFFAIVTLDFLRVRGAILIGIVGVTVLSFFFGGNQFHGIVSAPPSIDADAVSPRHSRCPVGRRAERDHGVLPRRTVRCDRHADGRRQSRGPAGRRQDAPSEQGAARR